MSFYGRESPVCAWVAVRSETPLRHLIQRVRTHSLASWRNSGPRGDGLRARARNPAFAGHLKRARNASRVRHRDDAARASNKFAETAKQRQKSGELRTATNAREASSTLPFPLAPHAAMSGATSLDVAPIHTCRIRSTTRRAAVLGCRVAHLGQTRLRCNDSHNSERSQRALTVAAPFPRIANHEHATPVTWWFDRTERPRERHPVVNVVSMARKRYAVCTAHPYARRTSDREVLPTRSRAR